jgi:hypothetical protein
MLCYLCCFLVLIVACYFLNWFQYDTQMLTSISTVDDLNYPEKTETYYVVNVPYIFSACWKVLSVTANARTYGF